MCENIFILSCFFNRRESLRLEFLRRFKAQLEFKFSDFSVAATVFETTTKKNDFYNPAQSNSSAHLDVLNTV